MGLDWGDLNPLTWPGQVKRSAQKDFGGLTEDPTAEAKAAQLNRQGQAAGKFADTGEEGYGQMTAESAAMRQAMQRRAQGQDSLSAEQLRQGLGQQLAMQRSMAASASPQNAAMAARTGAMAMGRASSGMAGNQAMAGIQERSAAEKALADMIMQKRQQDAQVALGSRQNAIGGYGGVTPQGTPLQQYAPYIQAGSQAAAMAASDERLKKDIKDGDEKSKRILQGLKSYSYKYRDEKYGAGKQFGPMAQDMERAGLGHAVVNTSEGKMVHGAKAALAGLGLVAALGKRVAKLEGGRK